MGMDCLFIGFAIYRVTECDMMHKPLQANFFAENEPVARSSEFIDSREVCEYNILKLQLLTSYFLIRLQVSCRFKLPPGHYLIVPSTYEPNEDGEFLIRVFSEQRNTMECANYPY